MSLFDNCLRRHSREAGCLRMLNIDWSLRAKRSNLLVYSGIRDCFASLAKTLFSDNLENGNPVKPVLSISLWIPTFVGMTGNFITGQTQKYPPSKPNCKAPILIIILSIALLLGIGVLKAYAADAVDTLNLSLDNAILRALEHNPAVRIQRFQIEISDEKIRAEKAAFYPDASASVSKSKSESERRVGSLRDPVGVTDERTSYSIEVTNAMPTGTRITAGITLDGAVSSLYSDQYTGRMGLTVTQALLQGMGPAVNLASLNKARLDSEISNSELKAIAQQLVFDVEEAYWNLYLSLRIVKIREESVVLAERQVEETRQRIAVGKLPELELAAAEAELAARRVALLDARSDRRKANLRLSYLLSDPGDDKWERFIKPSDEPIIPSDSLAPLEEHLELGRIYRPDLTQARIEIKKGQIEVVRTRNGLLPKLDLFIDLGGSAYAQSFGDAVPNFSTPYYDINAGLALTMPVPGSRKTSEHHQSYLTLKEKELLLDNMEQLLELDIRTAYIEVGGARERIEATRIVRELQEANYSAELEKFRVGKSTNLQVALVQSNLTEAQLEEARTKVSYLTALTSLYLSEGTLLERSGIEPEKTDH